MDIRPRAHRVKTPRVDKESLRYTILTNWQSTVPTSEPSQAKHSRSWRIMNEVVASRIQERSSSNF